MEPADILLTVLIAVACVAAGVAIWALRELAEAARSVRALSDDTRERLLPLLEKADVTVDAVNAELLRVDGIITKVETATARVSHASGTISEIVNAPAEIVTDVASRVRRAWKDRHRGEGAEAVDSTIQSQEGSARDDDDDAEAGTLARLESARSSTDQVAPIPESDSGSDSEGGHGSATGPLPVGDDR